MTGPARASSTGPGHNCAICWHSLVISFLRRCWPWLRMSTTQKPFGSWNQPAEQKAAATLCRGNHILQTTDVGTDQTTLRVFPFSDFLLLILGDLHWRGFHLVLEVHSAKPSPHTSLIFLPPSSPTICTRPTLIVPALATLLLPPRQPRYPNEKRNGQVQTFGAY